MTSFQIILAVFGGTVIVIQIAILRVIVRRRKKTLPVRRLTESLAGFIQPPDKLVAASFNEIASVLVTNPELYARLQEAYRVRQRALDKSLYRQADVAFEPDVFEREIQSLVDNGGFKEATSRCLHVLDAARDDAQRATIHRMLHRVARRAGDRDAARYHLLQALTLGPEDAETHFNACVFYKFLPDDLDLAIEHCERAIRLSPENPVYLNEMGFVLWQQYEKTKRPEILKKAIDCTRAAKDNIDKASSPVAIYIINNLAYYLAETGEDANIKEAVKIIERLPRDNRFCLDTVGYVILAACKAGVPITEAQKKEALTAMGKAISIEPDRTVIDHLLEALKLFY
jgi:tetratricopeptide (TPR) repeat protein